MIQSILECFSTMGASSVSQNSLAAQIKGCMNGVHNTLTITRIMVAHYFGLIKGVLCLTTPVKFQLEFGFHAIVVLCCECCNLSNHIVSVYICLDLILYHISLMCGPDGLDQNFFFCKTLNLEKRVCVTCAQKNQIQDVALFISVRCLPPVSSCAIFEWKVGWNSYRFVLEQNNYTKAQVIPRFPWSVC